MLILDSGAFSVWTKGKQINIDDYIDFIKANLDIVDIVIALDVIPGTPNQPLTLQDRKEAAKQSRINYLYMLKKGISQEILMPVFHQGEEEKWLAKMVKDCEYVGISPANDKTPEQRALWIDNVCFDHIINPDGTPKVKFHGFGVTSIRLVKNYPWFSVDSTSWLNGGKNSYIYCPSMRQDGFDFLQEWTIFAGEKVFPHRHVNHTTPLKVKIVEDWLAQAGITKQEILDSYKKRNYANFHFFLEVEKQLPGTNFVFAGAEGLKSHLIEEDRLALLKLKPNFLLSYAITNKKFREKASYLKE